MTYVGLQLDFNGEDIASLGKNQSWVRINLFVCNKNLHFMLSFTRFFCSVGSLSQHLPHKSWIKYPSTVLYYLIAAHSKVFHIKILFIILPPMQCA